LEFPETWVVGGGEEAIKKIKIKKRGEPKWQTHISKYMSVSILLLRTIYVSSLVMVLNTT